MSPIDKCALEFVKHGVDFAAILELHYKHGYVFSTPDFFVMGRPVNSEWTPDLICDPAALWDESYRPTLEPDAWWLHGAAGKMEHIWGCLPYPLRWIGFERFDGECRFYAIDTVRRLTIPTHNEMASAN